MKALAIPLHLLTLLLVVGAARPTLGAEDEKKAEEGTPAKPEVVYAELNPPFVVNYGNPTKGHHYLQARIVLQVEGQEAADKVEYHKAPLRQTLVMLLSGIPRGQADSAEQRETIRKQALKAIQDTMKDLDPSVKITDLLFTSFVIQ